MADALEAHAPRPEVILAIPRGGVVVGAVVARRLGVPLDVVVPRKVGAPGNPELAVGAVAEGVEAIDHQAVRRLGLDPVAVQAAARAETEEVARRTAAYRAGQPPLDLSGRTVALVDDGVATGWTCVAAARWCRRAGAKRVILAVPVGPAELRQRLGAVVDEIVVLETPEPYLAVGQVYARFPQVSDDEVLRRLEELRREGEHQGEHQRERQPPR